MLRYLCCLIACWAFLPLTIGCGPSRPAMAPVSGKILQKGQPLEGATVVFVSAGGGRPSMGVTDAEGKFTLEAFNKGDGAVVGNHVVTVSKYAKSHIVPLKNDETGITFRSEAERMTYYNPPSLLPDRYGNEVQTPFRATVTSDGPNDFTFEIK